jgi:hypothetical protein
MHTRITTHTVEIEVEVVRRQDGLGKVKSILPPRVVKRPARPRVHKKRVTRTKEITRAKGAKTATPAKRREEKRSDMDRRRKKSQTP